MTVGIYAIYSATDGACLYVGQSKAIEARFRQHITKLKNRRTRALPRFVEWYHAHGARERLLHLVILEECADDDLIKNELESFWFDELHPRFYGKAPSLSETWTHSEVTRSKIGLGVTKYVDSGLTESGRKRDEQGRPLFLLPCSLESCLNQFWYHRRDKRFCSKECEALMPIRGRIRTKASVTREELESYLKAGLSIYEIAEKLGFSAMTVSRLLRDSGLRVGVDRKQYERAIIEVSRSQLLGLYETQGLSMTAVGKELGLSSKVVGRLLDFHSISRRDASAAARRWRAGG